MNLTDPRLANAVKLHQARDFAGAEKLYRQVLQNQPWNVDAIALYGMFFQDTGRPEQAVEHVRKAISLAPTRDDLRRALIAPLCALGRQAEAVVEARELVRLKPAGAENWAGLSQLLVQTNQNREAVNAAARACELVKNNPDLLVILARALAADDRPQEALNVVEQARRIAPNHADAVIDRAVILQTLGRIHEAIAEYQLGLKLAPQNVPAWNNLGSCLMTESRAVEAAHCFEQAAKLWPHSAKPRNNIGAALKEMGNIDAALPHLLEATRLDPGYGEAWSNIGASYGAIGEHGKAIEAYQNAVRITPKFAPAYDNLLMSLISLPDVNEEGLFKQHADWGVRYADPLANQIKPWTNSFTTDRKIRIGYVSPDFREHSVRYFFEPILFMHDKSRFEIHCYACGRRKDAVTDVMRGASDGWHVVAPLTDPQMADLIRSHQIDILVDLAGHTSDNRMVAMAYKPAPIQVTYLGYPTTSGMRTIDYRITDSVCDGPDADKYYTEKLVRMPQAFFVYADDPKKPYDGSLPVDRNGYFTFGSFNSFTKVHPALIDAWARIMSAVPKSRLFLKAKPMENPSTKAAVIAAFAKHGIGLDRLDIRSWVELKDHINLLGSLDLMLDTHPYSGHTTTCQSLWMGSPVLTWYGQAFRSRVGLTIMQHMGLPQMAVASEADYIRRAIELATNPQELRELRPTLRQRMMQSPLCDARAFTANLESAYTQMWQRACAGRAAK
jgi:predicted O-linked N-acetylglucosamine transferase (SPINDLY family)